MFHPCCCCIPVTDSFDNLDQWTQSSSAWTIVSGKASTTTTGNLLYRVGATLTPRYTKFTLNGSGVLRANFQKPLLFDTAAGTVKNSTVVWGANPNFSCAIGSPPYVVEVLNGSVTVNGVDLIRWGYFSEPDEGFTLVSGSSMTVDDFTDNFCSASECPYEWFPPQCREEITVTITDSAPPAVQPCANCALREGTFVLSRIGLASYQVDGDFGCNLDRMRVTFYTQYGGNYVHGLRIEYFDKDGSPEAGAVSGYVYGWRWFGSVSDSVYPCGDSLTIAGPMSFGEYGSLGAPVLCTLSGITIDGS